ncbi:hypothetical protein I6H48_06195 [Corynebacterium amycolatum]|uniref:Uncharacterized protein n=1 Tax=Corynebacterium amycolatum TaxID=43765 RepID=A0A7T4G7N9_CORAY|nr:hypothetical protein [Corynebacterium amycolatum]QQB83766.1 hypothetical protein I6H48_06195 [Corynebacterium amycolatum]
MTPEEAAAIIDRWANEGQPTISITDVVDAVTTSLEMRTEYAIEYQPTTGPVWYRVSDWSEEYPLIDGEELNPRERIVMRYVTAAQPLGEEQ